MYVSIAARDSLLTVAETVMRWRDGVGRAPAVPLAGGARKCD
jgi:hypothetical protein